MVRENIYGSYGEFKEIVSNAGVREQYAGVLAIGEAIEKSKKLKTQNKVRVIREAFRVADLKGEQAYMAVAALDGIIDSYGNRSDKRHLRDRLVEVRNEAINNYGLDKKKLGNGFESYLGSVVSQGPLFEEPQHMSLPAKRRFYDEIRTPLDLIRSAKENLGTRTAEERSPEPTKLEEIVVAPEGAQEERRIGLPRLLRPVVNIAAGLALGALGILGSSCISFDSARTKTYSIAAGAGDDLGVGIYMNSKDKDRKDRPMASVVRVAESAADHTKSDMVQVLPASRADVSLGTFSIERTTYSPYNPVSGSMEMTSAQKLAAYSYVGDLMKSAKVGLSNVFGSGRRLERRAVGWMLGSPRVVEIVNDIVPTARIEAPVLKKATEAPTNLSGETSFNNAYTSWVDNTTNRIHYKLTDTPEPAVKEVKADKSGGIWVHGVMASKDPAKRKEQIDAYNKWLDAQIAKKGNREF